MRRTNSATDYNLSHEPAALLARFPLSPNALVALDVLLTECHVSRAAAKLGITQPALSHTLSQLRGYFGDQLLVKGKDGLVPTALALQVWQPLRRGLTELARAIGDQPVFVPATSKRRFRLAMSDYMAAVLAPSLIERITQHAPDIDLDIISANEPTAAAAQLAAGELDIACGVGMSGGTELKQKMLWRDDFVTVVRQRTLQKAERSSGARNNQVTWTAEEFCKYRHMLISPTGKGTGPVDDKLAKLGLSRRISVRFAHFLAAHFVIERNDIVLTCPRRLAAMFATRSKLIVVEPPISVPSFGVQMIWHHRDDNDVANQWLRGMLRDTCSELEQQASESSPGTD